MKFEAQPLEFPFVERMPKREKSKFVRAWDAFKELSRVTEEKGMLIPQSFAAKVLGVSRQRVWDLVQADRLETVEVNGVTWVTENSVIAYAQSERKAGRPHNVPETVSAAVKRAVEGGREAYQEVKRGKK